MQVVAEIEELPSPTPKEKDEPTKKDSSSNPKTQRINQLLRQVYEMEILEREILEKHCYIDQEEQAATKLLPRDERNVCFPKKTKQKIPEIQHQAV